MGALGRHFGRKERPPGSKKGDPRCGRAPASAARVGGEGRRRRSLRTGGGPGDSKDSPKGTSVPERHQWASTGDPEGYLHANCPSWGRTKSAQDGLKVIISNRKLGDPRGIRGGSAGDPRGIRAWFGGSAPVAVCSRLGFGGIRLRPLSPYIILKGGNVIFSGPCPPWLPNAQPSKILQCPSVGRGSSFGRSVGRSVGW